MHNSKQYITWRNQRQTGYVYYVPSLKNKYRKLFDVSLPHMIDVNNKLKYKSKNKVHYCKVFSVKKQYLSDNVEVVLSTVYWND